jgi:Yip1 domain
VSDPNSQFQAPPPPPVIQTAPAAPRPVKIRPVAIGIFVLGLLVLVGGLAKILPGGLATGVIFAFWGILLFAFSFIPLPQTAGADEPPMSGLQKLAGIFFEPTRVFKNLRVHPRWLAALLLLGSVNALYTAAFVQRLTPTRIVDFTMEKLVDSPIKPPADKMEAARENAFQQASQPIQRLQTAAKSFVGVFAMSSFVAGLCMLGVLAFGGRINFWQAFVAVIYAYLPIAVLSKVLSLVILFLKSPDDIHPVLGAETLVTDNLGVLFAPGQHPALFVLGSAVGVLSLYGLWLRAKGLAAAGQKVSSSQAWGVTLTIFILTLIFGMVMASLFSGFLS